MKDYGDYGKYIEGKGVLVGSYNELDLANGVDKVDVKIAKRNTGLKYTNQTYQKKNKKIVAVKIYMCTVDDCVFF